MAHFQTKQRSLMPYCDLFFAMSVMLFLLIKTEVRNRGPAVEKQRLSAPATTATHSRVIRLRRVLTDHPPSGSSIDPGSVAV